MSAIEYSTAWFVRNIQSHSEVSSATARPSGHVELSRVQLSQVIVAPVSLERLEQEHVDRLLDEDAATIICVIPKTSHYMWEARERAIERESTTHTMKELYTSLADEDPRPHLDKNVAYATDILDQHSSVRDVNMICESSMTIVRKGGLDSICIAIEYEYEFSEEALVKALKRHPEVHAILNSNPNGTPTRAALQHAAQARVGLFKLRELMGALRHDGDSFFDYRPPKGRRR